MRTAVLCSRGPGPPNLALIPDSLNRLHCGRYETSIGDPRLITQHNREK